MLSIWIDTVAVSSQTDSMDSFDVEHVYTADPATGLYAVGALHRLAERVEAVHVAAARRAGWSWEQIGDVLGVTRQSVHAKYGKRERNV